MIFKKCVTFEVPKKDIAKVLDGLVAVLPTKVAKSRDVGWYAISVRCKNNFKLCMSEIMKLASSGAAIRRMNVEWKF